MKTKLLKKDELNIAVELIQKGELVAFPTDTVYGLGADATNEQAVQNIFQAKGRPTNRPINVLVADQNAIKKYASDVPEEAFKLVDNFWPGPFTIILKDAGKLAASITAGKNTVGMRMPDLKIARELIHLCGVPLATPSANSSGRPSPTRAEHVLDDLGGQIAAIIDGGLTPNGIESTILDYSDPNYPLLIRPGSISKEEIESVIQKEVHLVAQETEKTKSITEKHYEPTVPLYIVESDWERVMEKLKNQGEKIGLLAHDEVIQLFEREATSYFSLGKKNDMISANKNLFQGLRYLEQTEATIILASPYPKQGLGIPFMNRLENAANNKTI